MVNHGCTPNLSGGLTNHRAILDERQVHGQRGISPLCLDFVSINCNGRN